MSLTLVIDNLFTAKNRNRNQLIVNVKNEFQKKFSNPSRNLYIVLLAMFIQATFTSLAMSPYYLQVQ